MPRRAACTLLKVALGTKRKPQINEKLAQHMVTKPEEFEIKVLLFAKARELVKHDSVALAVKEGSTAKQILAELVRRLPQLKDLVQSSVLAINHEFVDKNSDQVVKAGDEVAFIPPISGG